VNGVLRRLSERWTSAGASPAFPEVDGERRQVIVHYHIFKNAGTSLDTILNRNFPGRWVSYDREDPGALIPADELERVILEHPRAVAFSSHQCRPPLPANRSLQVHPIFILRHPLARIESIYRFERKQGGGHSGPATAHELPFRDYLEWRLADPERAAVLSNFQVRYLCPSLHRAANPWLVPLAQHHLREAIAFLGSLLAFGLVERFDESLAWLHRWLAPAFPGIEFSATRTNATSEEGQSVADRIASLTEKVGPALAARVKDANRFDLELHRHASDLFAARSGAPAPGGASGSRDRAQPQPIAHGGPER